MNDLSVRQAILSDLDELATLFDSYRVFQGRPSDPAAARAFLRERFDHGESVVFMAFDGRQALGFAQLYPSFSSVALQRVFILNDLFVHASGRRRGVASALLAAVERHAWSLGAVRVSLNVARDNLAGQALYAAQGWTQDAQFHMFHRYTTAG
jgi:GNAT superfamily N-acetyltransferase